MIVFRRAGAADRDAILQLRGVCYPGVDPEKGEPAFWEWQSLANPAGESMPFVAEENGACIAHFALLPQRLIAEGEVLRSALAIDAMTHPSVRKRGVYSKLVAFAAADVAQELVLSRAFQRRPDVLHSMTRNGWKISNRWHVLVRPVSVTNLIRRHDVSDPLARVADDRVLMLSRNDIEDMSQCARAMESLDTVSGDRSPEWLRWRFFDNPLVRYRVTGIGSAGELAAWLITRRVSLTGIDTLAIVDVAFRDRAAANLLLTDALNVARGAGVAVMAALISPRHAAFRLLMARGFLPSHARFRHLVREFDAATQSFALARWALTWADTDHV